MMWCDFWRFGGCYACPLLIGIPVTIISSIRWQRVGKLLLKIRHSGNDRYLPHGYFDRPAL